MTGFQRSVALDDISIRAGGDGRTVTAYAAMFDAPYEVTDAEGHYEESITRTAFDRSLSHGIQRFQVLFNHGLTVHGASAPEYSMPLGVPVEIRADGRGLLTVTRYSKTPLADEVLELIRDGAIRGMSFGGRWVASEPVGHRHDGLLRIQRREVALREYGPTPFPMNSAAAIVGVRSLLEEIRQLPDDQRAELAAALTGTTSTGPALLGTPAVSPPPVADTPAQPAIVAPADLGPSITQLLNDQRRRR